MTAALDDPFDHAEAEKLARAILTRRRIKCRALGYHVEDGCPSCGL